MQLLKSTTNDDYMIAITAISHVSVTLYTGCIRKESICRTAGQHLHSVQKRDCCQLQIENSIQLLEMHIALPTK